MVLKKRERGDGINTNQKGRREKAKVTREMAEKKMMKGGSGKIVLYKEARGEDAIREKTKQG